MFQGGGVSIFGTRYSYILAEDGEALRWDGERSIMLSYLVGVGDLINPGGKKSGWRKVVRVVHYPEGAVLYTVSVRSMQE